MSEDFSIQYDDDAARVHEFANQHSHLNLPDGLKQFKFPAEAKTVTLDILPFAVRQGGNKVWRSRLVYWVHRNIGRATYLCSGKSKCPICQYAAKMPFGANTPLWKSLRTQVRHLYCVRLIAVDSTPMMQIPYNKSELMLFDQSEWCFARMVDERVASRDTSDADEDNWKIYADLTKGSSVRVFLQKSNIGDVLIPSSIDFRKRKWAYKSQDLSTYCFDEFLHYDSDEVLVAALKQHIESFNQQQSGQTKGSQNQAAQTQSSWDKPFVPAGDMYDNGAQASDDVAAGDDFMGGWSNALVG